MSGKATSYRFSSMHGNPAEFWIELCSKKCNHNILSHIHQYRFLCWQFKGHLDWNMKKLNLNFSNLPCLFQQWILVAVFLPCHALCLLLCIHRQPSFSSDTTRSSLAGLGTYVDTAHWVCASHMKCALKVNLTGYSELLTHGTFFQYFTLYINSDNSSG